MLIYDDHLDFSSPKWQTLFKRGTKKDYLANDIIYRQGESFESLGCLLSGIVKISVNLPHGSEKTKYFIKGPFLIGELSLIDNRELPDSSTAFTKVAMMHLSKEEMQNAFINDQDLLLQVFRVVSKKARCLAAHQEESFSTIPKKLARFLYDSHHYGLLYNIQGSNEINISQEDIASLIGTCRQRVCQSLNEFEKMGFISKRRNFIYVENLKALESYYLNSC